ncbi:MAG: YggS family pyridoxal phosphate-dependent enzyme [candidate division Zixibacteria bacterium]|nr:YggS family pyridoxal phosphate-dependent enzyme [candidate division Zixibacteria bacterium]
MVLFDDVRENVARLRREIDQGLERSGRTGDSVAIVAVTKRFPPEAINAAVAAGITDIGENRVQETSEKKPKVDVECRWHLIGHLQKNKINKALELYDMIQSVDSYELADAINTRTDPPVEILLQVDSSGEETKFGLDPETLIDTAKRISMLDKIQIRGLMTIGPLTDDETRIMHSFKMTRSLFEELRDMSLPNCEMKFLSMGMSGDYRIAIEEGSNMIRVGTAIFGERT